METTKILQTDMLDILFEHKNKDYGAYQLRRQYNKRLSKSLLGTAFIVLLFITFNLMAKNSTPQLKVKPIVKDLEVSIIEDDKPKIIEPPKKEVAPPKEDVKIDKFTPPNIVPNAEVKPQDEMKDQSDLNEANIGKIDVKGPETDFVPEAIVENNNTRVVDKNATTDEPININGMGFEAEFPGGIEKWKRFLENNLRGYVPINNGAPPGRYQIIIQFVVDREGNLSDIKPITNFGYGMEEEAMRVIRKSNKWKPALQNGQPVKAYRKQPIVFDLKDE